MLSKIPFEVACNIIQYLETTELLVCSTICREWRDLIIKRQLIRVLEPTTTRQLNSVIDAIEDQYIDGSQITQLATKCALDGRTISFIDLARYFPKLKKLEYNSDPNADDHSLNITKENVETFKEWRHCLESLCILGLGSEMVILFENCRFERLVHLDIGYDDELTVEHDLISTLEYLPQLKSLTIRGRELSFSSLERLHKYLPFLEKLELEYSFFVFPEGIPQFISPAKKLTHLTCNSRSIDRNEQFMLQYILAKYPSLDVFNITRDFIESTLRMFVLNHVATTMEPAFLSLIAQLPSTLRTFKAQAYRISKAVIDAVAKLPHVDTFYLCTNSSMWPDAPALEYCHSKGFLQNLEQLWLSTLRFQEIGIDAGFETSLKKLDVVCDYFQMTESREILHLDNVFKVHPLLKNLSISAPGYSADISNDIKIEPLKIKQLSLHVDMLSDRVIPFIRDTMPCLKRLSIVVYDRHIGLQREEDDKKPEFHAFSWKEISLPNHSLEYFKLNVPLAASVIICSVSSIIDNKRKYYLFSRKTSKVHYCGMELPNISEMVGVVVHRMDIYCKELWHLHINSVKIF